MKFAMILWNARNKKLGRKNRGLATGSTKSSRFFIRLQHNEGVGPDLHLSSGRLTGQQ